MALDDVQWPCIECRIKDEHFKTYRAELESHIQEYKGRILNTHTVIEKYKEKNKECENLYQQLKICWGMLDNYKCRTAFALRATFPIRCNLNEMKAELVSVQSQLVSESEALNASRLHNTQLQNCISDLEEKNAKLEKELEESKGNTRTLQRQLRSFNQPKYYLKNKKKCVKLVADKGVQVEGNALHNKLSQDLDPNASEDEGIFSLDRSSICSSIDSRSNSVDDFPIDVGVCHSPEILPEGHQGVRMKEMQKQLHVNKKEKDVSRTYNVLEVSSVRNQVITDLNLSSDEDDSQNSAAVNNSWSLNSDSETEGEKHENPTSKIEPADKKRQTNKILPLLDPSTKPSHSLAVGEHPLKNHTEQQKLLPLLTVQSAESEVSVMKSMPSLPSMLAENQNNLPSGRQSQNQSEGCKTASSINFVRKQYKSKDDSEGVGAQKMDCMALENILPTNLETSAVKHNFSLQSNSLISVDINNLTLEQTEVSPHVGISGPECKNPLQKSTMLKTASKNQKQHPQQQKNKSTVDAVEMEDRSTLQTKLKSCSSKPETVNETHAIENEKLKKSAALSAVQHKDTQYIDDSFCHLSADDFTEDLCDSILKEMVWQCSPLSPISDLTPILEEESTSCSVAVETETILLCDAGIQTAEEYLPRKLTKLTDVVIQTENVGCNRETQTFAAAEEFLPRKLTKLTDVVIQTENMGCNRETQTCAGDQVQHNKKLVSVAVQTEVHETHVLIAQHTPACTIDSSNTVHENPCRRACVCKRNTSEACRDAEIRESLHHAVPCNLNQEALLPGCSEDDAKDKCCCKMPISCPSKDIEHSKNSVEMQKLQLQLFVRMLEQQSEMFRFLFRTSSITQPVLNCNIDHNFRKQLIKASQHLDSINVATYHKPPESFGVHNLHTSGDCLCCNKNLENMEGSMLDVTTNSSIMEPGNSVELKHENSFETSEKLIHRGVALENHARDREEKIELEKRIQDSSSIFGHILGLSSDDDDNEDKSSNKISINDVPFRKRAVESDSDSEALVEHNLLAKRRKKQRFKRICVPSSDDDDSLTPVDAENNKVAIKTSTPKKITRQSCNSAEYTEHSTGKSIPNETMLKVAQTVKKNSKIRMRMNIVKAKAKVKIPRASPERASQRLKNRSEGIDVHVSSPAKSPREIKTSCDRQSNVYSLPPALKPIGPKISQILPTHVAAKERSSQVRMPSLDEERFIKATDVEKNKPAIKTSACNFRIPMEMKNCKSCDTIAIESCKSGEHREHSSGRPARNETVLQVAQTVNKKKSKMSKLEKMRMNVVKAKTRMKIPRASPERASPRLKKKSVEVDTQISSPAMRRREVKKPCISQSNAHSLPPALQATRSKRSPLLTSHVTDNVNTKSPQVSIPAVRAGEVRKFSNSRSSASVILDSAPTIKSGCSESGMSVSLRSNRTDNESTKSSNTRQIRESNTHASDNLFMDSSVQKFGINTEEGTIHSLSGTPLSPPLAEAASSKKVNVNEPDEPTERISDAQNNLEKGEKNTEELKKGCCIQWALKLLQKEADQEREKQIAFRGSSKIEQRVKKTLKELESETFDDEYLAFVVQELTAIDKTCVVDYVARSIIKAVELDNSLVDKTYTPPAPPLTVLQQRLMALIFTLHYEHQMFKELPERILLAIEYKTLRLGRSPNMDKCHKLVCFYSAMCRVLKDVKRVQLFCLDALYSLHYKSAAILNIVLCMFPEALPHAHKGKDIPLVKCLVFFIFTPVQYKKKTNFRINPLKDLVHHLYGYQPGEFTADQLLSFLLEKLRNEENKEVPIALILLAKRMSHEWTHKTLVEKNLKPLVDEWKAAKLQNSAFAKILPVMGYIARCFPIGESRAFIEKTKDTFVGIMNDENVTAEVQEGAVMALLSLSRHNPNDILDILRNWLPKMKLSNKVLHKIAAFMQYKPLKFWTGCTSS